MHNSPFAGITTQYPEPQAKRLEMEPVIDEMIDQMLNLLGTRLNQSLDNGRALPGEFYSSETFFELERHEILRKEWLCVGRADQIPFPGDYFTTHLLGEPLLLVRGDDQRIRALVNICRHRGMVIAEGAGHTRYFTCPYHAWSYNRTGQLLRAPRIETSGHFDPTQCKLPEFPIETWNGFVFVNIDGTAPPLKPRLVELEGLLANYQPEQMHYATVQEEAWNTNWKCVVENFLEGYHLSVLHRNTLHAITPTSGCVKFPGGAGHTGYKAYYADAVATSVHRSPRLTESEQRCSILFCVYPSLCVTLGPDKLRYLALQPTTAGTVSVRRGTGYYEEDLSSEEIQLRLNQWNRILAEDHATVERMQRGYSSMHTATGPLASVNYEGTILDFHQYLSKRLTLGTGHFERNKVAAPR